MSPRNSLLLCAIALVLTGASFFHAAGHYETTTVSKRPIEIRTQDVTSFLLWKDGVNTASFYQENDRWIVKLNNGALTDVADPIVIEDLMAIVVRLFNNPQEKLDRVKAGIDVGDSSKATQLVIGSKDQTQSVFLGKTSDDSKYRYVAFGGEPTVHGASTELLRVLDRNPNEYRSHRLFDVMAGIPNQIDLVPPGPNGESRRITLEQIESGWVVSYPVNWPASAAEIDRLLRLSESLRVKDYVSDNIPSDLRPFGLDRTAGKLRIRTGETTQVVRFGKPIDGDHVYALREGRKSIYKVENALSTDLMKMRILADQGQSPVKRYRKLDLGLLPVLPPMPFSFLLSRVGEGTLRITFDKNGIVAGDARTFDLDHQSIDDMVNVLRNVKALRFVNENGEHPERYGLAPPFYRIVCLDSKGKEVLNLHLSNIQKDGKTYAQIEGRPQILEIHPAYAVELTHPFIHYKTRLVKTFDWKKVRKLTVTDAESKRVYLNNGGNVWQLAQPTTYPLRQDTPKFIAMLLSLSELTCKQYVTEQTANLSQFGLDHPLLHVVVNMRPESAETQENLIGLDLLIGKPTVIDVPGTNKKRRLYFSRLRDSGPVFLLPDTLVDKLIRTYK